MHPFALSKILELMESGFKESLGGANNPRHLALGVWDITVQFVKMSQICILMIYSLFCMYVML